MKIISYLVGIFLGILVIAPPIDYTLPMMANTHWWAWCVMAAIFMAILLLPQKLHPALKCLMLYMIFDCFFSQVPYMSFNAYIVFVGAIYLYFILTKCDYEIILNAIQAAFWMEVIFLVAQHFGKDTLINFDRPEKLFFGTVAQEMRVGSILAILAPLVVLKNRWYLVPVLALTIFSKTLGFTLALVAGGVVYLALTPDVKLKHKIVYFGVFFALAVAYSVHAWDHIRVEIIEGRLPIWLVVIKSWFCNTMGKVTGYTKDAHGMVTGWNWDPTYHNQGHFLGVAQSGPFCLDKLILGHGPDTFLPMFVYYKHDNNPFGQTHNDWLQIMWETGLIGFGLVAWYAVDLCRRLYQRRENYLLAGLAVISVNMFFAFPMRMTQTFFLMLAFIAWCELEANF